MQKKVIFLISFSAFILTGCKFPPSIYKKDILQGNHVEQAQLDQLKSGQSKTNVQKILGSPTHISTLDVQQWHYHYYFKSGQTNQVTHKPFSIVFKDNQLSCYKGTVNPAHLNTCQDESLTR